MRNILVGTSSWTDKSLLESGGFYPISIATPEARLRYYASQFPIVEIDSSYYGIPTEAQARLWVERTPQGFVFNIKAYRLFTRHQTPIVSLAKDIRAALGPSAKANVYEDDVPEELSLELWRRFRAALEVMRAAGKLGAGFPLAVEFRNKTWFDGERRTSRTLAFERDNEFVNVVVDEPEGIPNTIPSVWEVTNPSLAVVRMHGRNRETWNRKGLTVSSQRFNYEYSEQELEEFADDVTTLAGKAKRVHVLFNVNYQDQGQRAARTLTELLQRKTSSTS